MNTSYHELIHINYAQDCVQGAWLQNGHQEFFIWKVAIDHMLRYIAHKADIYLTGSGSQLKAREAVHISPQYKLFSPIYKGVVG